MIIFFISIYVTLLNSSQIENNTSNNYYDNNNNQPYLVGVTLNSKADKLVALISGSN